jgi:SAM-dependent methyltransferase
MNHADHVALLTKGIPEPGGVWADLGSGGGAFTLALADLLGSSAQIYSVDQDAAALRDQERALRARFPGVSAAYRKADFTRPLGLPALDGIVMANSLHFVARQLQAEVVRQVKSGLRPGGRLILVEYNADRGNMWVPYPLSYPSWEVVARQAEFGETHLLEVVPSRFLNEIYSAASW